MVLLERSQSEAKLAVWPVHPQKGLEQQMQRQAALILGRMHSVVIVIVIHSCGAAWAQAGACACLIINCHLCVLCPLPL